MKNLGTLGLFLCLLLLAGTADAGVETTAYSGRVDDQDGNRLKLSNETEVEIEFDRLDRLVGRPDFILFRKGGRWMIWIQHEGVYRCDVEGLPKGIRQYAEEERILEIKYRGEVILMEDGSIYEVDSRDTTITREWEGKADALVLRDSELLNFDHPRETVRVRKLR